MKNTIPNYVKEKKKELFFKGANLKNLKEKKSKILKSLLDGTFFLVVNLIFYDIVSKTFRFSNLIP